MPNEYTLGGPPPQSRSEKILMKQNPGPAQSRIEELLKNASGHTSGALIYKGTVETTMSLPSSGNEVGDVYHVNSDGSEWAWNGSAWEELGTAVDLSGKPFEIEVTQSGSTYSTTASAADILAHQDNCVAVLYGTKVSLSAVTGNEYMAELFFANLAVNEGAGYTMAQQIHISVNNGVVTVFADMMVLEDIPSVTSADDGKILGVANGAWTKTPPANALVIDFNSPYASAYDDAKAAMQGNREVYLSIPNQASNPTECIYLRANAWNATHITFGGLSSAYLPGGFFIMTYAHITSDTSSWFKWTTPFYFNPVLFKHLAPPYDSTATYSVGDYVTYGDNSLNTSSVYRCTTAITVAEEWNASHWTAVTVMGEITAVDDLPSVSASDNGKFLRVVSGAWAAADAEVTGDKFDDLKSALLSGAEEDAIWHLGFYLDENGDLCQVEEETNNG